MKFTKAHENAYNTMRNLLQMFYRGRLSYREFTTAVFKEVAHHRYTDAWVDIATVAMHSGSMAKFDANVNELFTEYEIA